MIEPVGWMREEGPDDDVVISTRARLARNLVGYRFPHRASDAERVEVAAMVRRALADEVPGGWRFVEPAQGRTDSRELLCAAMAKPGYGDRSGEVLACSGDGHEFVLINEEDHIRIQRLERGLATESCLVGAEALGCALADGLAMAFDPGRGYLAASPANTGLSLRISSMVHVPGLASRGKLDRLFRAAELLGLTARGVFGEGTRGLGHVYQISNQGPDPFRRRDEREGGAGDAAQRIRAAVQAAASLVVAAEGEARGELAARRGDSIRDAATCGTRFARECEWIGADVALLLSAWSDMRLGRALGIEGLPSLGHLTAMLSRWGRRFGTREGVSVLYK